MDPKSYHIVKTLLQLPDKGIWDFAKKHTEAFAKGQNWSQEQTKKTIEQNYNSLVKIKYQAADAIREKLTPEQQTLQNLSDAEIREVAASQAHNQFEGQGYTDAEFKNAESNLYQQMIDERTKAADFLSGKVSHPDINLATFDTTDLKRGQGMSEMRKHIMPLDLGKEKANENIFSKATGLTVQNMKETIKNPLNAIWNYDERHQRNMEVVSGKTLDEANLNMQDRKDRKPLNILANFLSGNPEKQDRSIKGAKSMFGNLLSGTGAGSKILPALAGFAGTKIAGFGSVTSILVAILASIIVPMIMRAFSGKKTEMEPNQGAPENQEEKQTEDATQKAGRTREQTLQKDQALNQAQEIERPSNAQQPTNELNNKQMQTYIQQNGLCALRTQLGADNPRFTEFVRNNHLETALKAEEVGKFNGKSDAIAATAQALTRINSPIVPDTSNTLKTGMGIG